MSKLKIFAAGTKYFMDTYSGGLKQDCERYGYDIETDVVPDGSFSELNYHIQQRMVEVVRHSSQRICFMDPECRIVQPIPDEWIDCDHPVVFYKIDDDAQTEVKYQYGQTLTCPIIMQPFFVGPQDHAWLEWWRDCSLAASDHENKQFVPHELFLEIAMKFNNIKMNKKFITYNRNFKGKHQVVKGSWSTQDTIIQHPAIQGVLDPHVKHAVTSRKKDIVLDKRELHNHFQDFKTVKVVDELMFKEIKDIEKWPISTIQDGIWYGLEDWQFDPSTGKLRHKKFSSERYHHSLRKKLELGVKTPVVKQFLDTNPA